MRVVVTGARGRVGAAAVNALTLRGHDVLATDLVGVPLGMKGGGYVQADLTDAGEAFAVIAGADAVVHLAGIPSATLRPAHALYATNVLSTFNCVEAAVRLGVAKFVAMSSEATLGFQLGPTSAVPDYLPVDEAHPMRPEDAYSLSKATGEQILDAAVRRSELCAVSIRSSWIQFEQNIESNVGELVRDRSIKSPNYHSYTDIYDMADALALAVDADISGHEVVFVAQPDNVGGWDFAGLVRETYRVDVPIRPLDRPDSSGISSAKAHQLLGWKPARSWRDYLDRDGHLRSDVRARYLEAGGTIRE